jgi:hypothetical protein
VTARTSNWVTNWQLHIVPVRFKDAREFVRTHHRHHTPSVGHKFSIGVAQGHELVGVAIVGRPVARHYDDGHTLEVTRTCTDGTANANSMLYGAAWRAAKALGYDRLITYTQHEESGISLRAAGWRVVAERPARSGWDAPSRRRQLRGTENVARTLWEAAS